MDSFVSYVVVGGLIALSVWARIRFYRPSDTRELPQKGSVDLSAFGTPDKPPNSTEPTTPHAD